MKVNRQVCLNALAAMESAFRRLESQVPPPQRVPYRDGFNYRYTEQMVEQALLQKLARNITGLHAIDVLLLNGFVQEQGVIQRTLDEIGEDINFLALALTEDTVTELHKEYLAAFWQEEFDAETAVASTQKRPMPRRSRIRAYINRIGGLPDPSGADAVGRTISKTYSGYVHGASPQIMDMVGGDPPRFHLQGMLGTPVMPDHVADGWNYFYRGLMAATLLAKAFGDAELVDWLYEQIGTFERQSGTEYFASSKPTE